MYCHVLAVKDKAAEIPHLIHNALAALPPRAARMTSVRAVSRDGDDTNFVMAMSTEPTTPKQRHTVRSSASPAGGSSPALANGRSRRVGPTAKGMLGAHSSLATVSPITAAPLRTPSADSLAGRPWVLKFDAIFLGVEPVSSANLDGVRSALSRNEVSRKSLEVRVICIMDFHHPYFFDL